MVNIVDGGEESMSKNMREKYEKEDSDSPLCSLRLHLQMEQNSWLTQDDCLTLSLKF